MCASCGCGYATYADLETGAYGKGAKIKVKKVENYKEVEDDEED
jgi:hypothetical protein